MIVALFQVSSVQISVRFNMGTIFTKKCISFPLSFRMSGIISAHNGWSLRRCARCSCPAAFLLPRLPEPIGSPRWNHWNKLQEQIDLFFRRFDSIQTKSNKKCLCKKNRHTHKSKWNERIQHEHRIARANRHCWIKVVMGCLSFVFSGVLKLNWRKIKSKPWVIIYVQTVIRWSCRTLWYRWIRTMLRIGNGIVQPTQFFHWWREPYSSRALC